MKKIPLGEPPEHYGAENEAVRQRQAQLKDRIRRSGLPVREPYRSAAELGSLVLADLTALIERLYPPQQPGEEAAEAIQQLFAAALARGFVSQ